MNVCLALATPRRSFPKSSAAANRYGVSAWRTFARTTAINKLSPPSRHPEIERIAIAQLRPWTRNARTHSRKQLRQIADSIERFGFTNPVLIDGENRILAGHGRVEAAKLIGMTEVPCLRFDHMSASEKRAYVLADNKLALNAGWDEELLALELKELSEADLDFSLDITGFSIAEVDSLIEGLSPEEAGDPAEDALPDPATTPRRCRPGDIYRLGPHRLICGDALDARTVEALMDGEIAEMVFTDPPYNVRIDGNVSGLGKVRHEEFAMASGEMSSQEFTAFLSRAFANLAAHSADGSIHFICMDWRHMGEMLDAGGANYAELKNLIVWVKDNGGMGSFYRSRHELVFAFKKGGRTEHQQLRTRAARPLPHQCLGVSRRELAGSRADGRARDASDGKAGRHDRRRDQGCLAAQGRRARPVRRLRLHFDRCAQDRSARQGVRA